MAFNKQEAFAAIDRSAELVCQVSDQVWEHPETAFEEFDSMRIHCDALEQAGFTVERGVGNIATAFTASFGSGSPKIGLLAEYDALSGLSQEAGVAVKTPLVEGGTGHGCGHNLLGASCLGAAIGVKEYLEKTGKSGTIVVYGCPGEEGGSGKAFMARDGVFDGLDAAISWHPGPSTKMGNYSYNANIQLYYKFHGISAHAGGSPWNGRSALDAVSLLNTGVQYLREHVTTDVRIHYAITNTGGYSPNVVQSYAEVLYLIRAKDVPSVQKVFERVNKIADGAALMTETWVEKDFIKACSNLVPNLTLCQLIHDNLELAGVPEFTDEDMDFAQRIIDSIPAASRENPDDDFNRIADPELRARLKAQWGDKPIHGFLAPVDLKGAHSGGSTDVGDVACIAPTVMFHTTTQAIGTPGHSWQHVAQNKSPLAKKGMIFACKGMAGAAIDLFENPDLLRKAKEEHAERMNHQAYTCPIPQGVKPRGISVKK